MERVPPFNPQQLEAIAKILADTATGLKGSQIAYLLQDARISDVSPSQLFLLCGSRQRKVGFVPSPPETETLACPVGSRAGAVLRRRGLSVSPRFLWEQRASGQQVARFRA